jgi:hypothetical protein
MACRASTARYNDMWIFGPTANARTNVGIWPVFGPRAMSEPSPQMRTKATGVQRRPSIYEFTPWSLLRSAEIERRQFDLRHLDLDLAEVDVERLVEQGGHDDRESDHDRHHDRLQADPG